MGIGGGAPALGVAEVLGQQDAAELLDKGDEVREEILGSFVIWDGEEVEGPTAQADADAIGGWAGSELGGDRFHIQELFIGFGPEAYEGTGAKVGDGGEIGIKWDDLDHDGLAVLTLNAVAAGVFLISVREPGFEASLKARCDALGVVRIEVPLNCLDQRQAEEPVLVAAWRRRRTVLKDASFECNACVSLFTVSGETNSHAVTIDSENFEVAVSHGVPAADDEWVIHGYFFLVLVTRSCLEVV
jgi:hypothetical protein